MTHKVDYKKIRTDIINGKKRCIYMKPKGKREYVKSGGEFVSLSAYIKTLQKKNKKKGGGDGEGDEEVNENRRYYGPDTSPVNSRQSSPQSSPRAATKTNSATLSANVPHNRTQSNNTHAPYENYDDINRMALRYLEEKSQKKLHNNV
jgi:Arc/MetJ-type ribon-helix-helix transcriptional regulator